MGETTLSPAMEWRIAPWTSPVIRSEIPIECPCTVVWHNEQFTLKFKSARCEIHRKVEQNMHGMPVRRQRKPRKAAQPRIHYAPAMPAASGTAHASNAIPKQSQRKNAR